SMQINAGEAVAVLGANGSGKTTLLRSILGLIPHQSGRIRLFGKDLAHFKHWWRIGYVPQHSQIHYQQAKVFEVVATGMLSKRRPLRPMSAAAKQQIYAALDHVGLANRVQYPYHRLSGGQQQRVLIARALAAQSELLVMDEPFSGIDLETQAQIARLITELKTTGTTLLIVLHDTGVLDDLLDRQIVLRAGKIIADAGMDASHHSHEVNPQPAATLAIPEPAEGLRAVLEASR
ncbi:MAG: ATP-binding cassette domain-containing protein, partial [Propionibacteriaceae bacterium]|nr:ATP-binding cassette domain-containing protein [Propionibacteriaceae bacterium]